MKRRIFTLATASLLAFNLSFAGTNLKVLNLDGSEKSEALAVIGKFTLSDGMLTLYSTSNEVLATTPISSVRKIVFEEGTTTQLENISANNNVTIYPNPTQDALQIDGIEQGETIRIYTPKGELLKSTKATGNTAQIPVSDLKKGTYLLQVQTNILKFIKK